MPFAHVSIVRTAWTQPIHATFSYAHLIAAQVCFVEKKGRLC